MESYRCCLRQVKRLQEAAGGANVSLPNEVCEGPEGHAEACSVLTHDSAV